jgi:hypothetical protein
MEGRVNTCDFSIHVVMSTKPKLLLGLSQKALERYRVLIILCHGHPTLPADREHLTHACQPCGTW